MTSSRLVRRDKLSGKGHLKAKEGGDLGTVQYRLQFYQTMLRTETMGGNVSEVDGLGSGRGSLVVAEGSSLDLWNTPEAVLVLEDGRQIDILFPNASPLATSVDFVTSGALREAS